MQPSGKFQQYCERIKALDNALLYLLAEHQRR
jgi:hypothetical protein